MNPDDRPVRLRTSVSARDFWCRPRDDSEESPDVSPDGKVISRRSSFLDNSNTPFGRQDRPGSMTSSSFANNNTFFATASPTASITLPVINVMSSRDMERLVLTKEIGTLESTDSVKADLEKKNAMLLRELSRAWQINKALAVAMAAGISK
jgi:hypothetical protein